MNPIHLTSKELEELAKTVLRSLPQRPRWWAFWRTDHSSERVKAVWRHIRDHAACGGLAATLDEEAFDVLRDCVEYGPYFDDGR